MRNISTSFLIVSILALLAAQASGQGLVDETELTVEAKEIVKEFGGTLKPKLIEAIQSGGLVHAIDFCSVEAPKIAQSLSEKTGWNVKRVSLKARNKTTGVPDGFETDVLARFNELQMEGRPVSEISYSEVTDGKYRFMGAQGVEGVCLSCHGVTISTEVQEALDKHYPGDDATGYSLGQIRGAFSLSKDL